MNLNILLNLIYRKEACWKIYQRRKSQDPHVSGVIACLLGKIREALSLYARCYSERAKLLDMDIQFVDSLVIKKLDELASRSERCRLFLTLVDLTNWEVASACFIRHIAVRLKPFTLCRSSLTRASKSASDAAKLDFICLSSEQ